MTDDVVIGEALLQLAIARGVELDPSVSQVYLDLLAKFPPEMVRRACHDLAYEERKPFEPAMPTVGTIVTRTEHHVQLDHEEQARAKLLPMPAGYYEIPEVAPPSKEQATHFVTEFKARVQRQIRRNHGEEVPDEDSLVADETGPRYFCLDCRDEPHNWRTLRCPGRGAVREALAPVHTPCQRTIDHHPHSFVVKCGCAAYNPVSRAARERMATARQRSHATPPST